MTFPPNLLSDDEHVVVDMHPHWWTITPLAALLGVVVIGGIFVLSIAGDGIGWTILQVIVGIGILTTLALFLVRYARWITTEFVVTTERVISRHGVMSKSGIEIPLDRINTVFFNQQAFERILQSGDLGIESAGEGGRQTFDNIRKPSKVQAEIYAQKEAFERRRLERIGEASAARAAVASIPEQIAQLDDLRKRGVLSDQEFEAKKNELLGRM